MSYTNIYRPSRQDTVPGIKQRCKPSVFSAWSFCISISTVQVQRYDNWWMMNQKYFWRKRWWRNRNTVLRLVARTDDTEQFEPGTSITKLKSSTPQTFLLAGAFCVRKLNMVPHTTAHVSIRCLDDKYTKLKTCISERKRKANWIGHILRRNRLLKQVIEGKIKGEMEVPRRRGRRRKKLLDDLKDSRGYFHLKEEALDRTMWRNRFGGGFGPVVRQTTE